MKDVKSARATARCIGAPIYGSRSVTDFPFLVMRYLKLLPMPALISAGELLGEI